ncbi:MAG: hybrid sensor histidine kinase/response regulator [Crocosphaera sp.]|nr:hybrid sensor histidine kinase/response regulator [Crocosphaera sp.]
MIDQEQQVRINFLDEAQDCYDSIESVLLGLRTTDNITEQLDLALRSAHSVKGGAGMMGFKPLSQVAHRLEDFFKILRVRHASTTITTEVETLLLQGVDSLRQVNELHRQETAIDDEWLKHQVNPIFEQLRHHLGDLQEEDENALFSQNSGDEPVWLMFEEGVETVLDQFEQDYPHVSPTELGETLAMTAEQLLIFGQMADLDPFIQLCESIQQQATLATTEQLPALTKQALTLWRRSHALVMRGSFEKLPSRLEGFDNNNPSARVLELDENDDSLDLFDAGELADFTELQAAVEQALDLSSETVLESREKKVESNVQPMAPSSQMTGKMVRVPVEQLYEINTLFGKLVLERNSINLRLEQLNNFVALMRQRITQLEQSNNQLKTWYDKASVEGMVVKTQESEPAPISTAYGGYVTLDNLTTQFEFDALEMDHYSDLHLISQEQIETIVQLQEVTSDMDLGLQNMTQAVQDFNQTTRSLQKNVTQTQMQPFADLVKPFPRLVRDLSLESGKKVTLIIEGETTLIDRTMVETLNAPLMHLIRNGFAHGLEDPNSRIAAGKPSTGTITLQAVNRGTETIITVKDDGRGIELGKICQRLREMGISDQEIHQMSTQEILDYIFQPGFTTSETVTELSGRGVGMDVVRRNLQDIRGDIRVETEAGKGTTFILKVPFTLSILRVMLIERSGLIFAVPANSVREVFPLGVQGGETLDEITWQEQTIPLLHLEKTLQFNRPHKPLEMSGHPIINKPTALIVGSGSTLGAIGIDRVWGEPEVTIRPIDSPLPLPMGIISSMMLGDGRVVPLIDPVQLLQSCLDTLLTSITPSFESSTQNKVKTILVVDDSINVRRYLTLTLEKAGYQVEQAKDGQDAVNKLVAGLLVDGVICDIEMPRLDGYGVLEELKTNSAFESLPIAMLTSRSNDKHRRLAMNLGASAYFSKPYNEQELLQTLTAIL